MSTMNISFRHFERMEKYKYFSFAKGALSGAMHCSRVPDKFCFILCL